MLFIAEATPFEQLVEMLKEKIQEYEMNPTPETKSGVEFICVILATKEAVNGMGGIEKTLKRIEDIETAKKLFSKHNITDKS